MSPLCVACPSERVGLCAESPCAVLCGSWCALPPSKNVTFFFFFVPPNLHFYLSERALPAEHPLLCVCLDCLPSIVHKVPVPACPDFGEEEGVTVPPSFFATPKQLVARHLQNFHTFFFQGRGSLGQRGFNIVVRFFKVRTGVVYQVGGETGWPRHRAPAHLAPPRRCLPPLRFYFGKVARNRQSP